jgi:hypothetical protein
MLSVYLNGRHKTVCSVTSVQIVDNQIALQCAGGLLCASVLRRHAKGKTSLIRQFPLYL